MPLRRSPAFCIGMAVPLSRRGEGRRGSARVSGNAGHAQGSQGPALTRRRHTLVSSTISAPVRNPLRVREHTCALPVTNAPGLPCFPGDKLCSCLYAASTYPRSDRSQDTSRQTGEGKSCGRVGERAFRRGPRSRRPPPCLQTPSSWP